MAIIVQKFGGSSVCDTHHIINVAKKIIDIYKKGNDVVAVVSAQGDTTDILQKKALEITSSPSKRELDVLLSSGEQISIALLTMAIQKLGYKAVSLTGWQAGIITSAEHFDACIENINVDRIKQELKNKNIVIVAGFQGIDEYGNITTLGRGGSDTSAVALAAALNAGVCKIYTDVDGVYTADPRIVKSAKKLPCISYDEMYELSHLGAQVLNDRSVETGKKFDIKIEVLSSLVDNSCGTIINSKCNKNFNNVISGISYKNNLAEFLMTNVKNVTDSRKKIFESLASNGIKIDSKLKPGGKINNREIKFLINEEDIEFTIETVKNVLNSDDFYQIFYKKGKSKISVINISESININIATIIFEILSELNVDIDMFCCDEKRVSIVVASENLHSVVNAIHSKLFEEDTLI